MALKGKTPRKAEKEWLAAICDLGCIVCLREFELDSLACPHHIDGKTKPDAHYMTIPLCGNHHQGGMDTAECTSRHPYKFRFEERYGTELELWDDCNERLEFFITGELYDECARRIGNA